MYLSSESENMNNIRRDAHDVSPETVYFFHVSQRKKNRPEIADGPLVHGYTFARGGGSGLELSTALEIV